MIQRQTRILRFFFLALTLVAFGEAALRITTQPGPPIAGALFVALGCAMLPFIHVTIREFFILRTALTWNMLGVGALALVVDLNRSLYAAVEVALVHVLFLVAVAIRASFRSAPGASSYADEMRQTSGQEERNRLARDLHDSIKQQIFAIQTGAAAVQVRFDSDPSGARDALAGVRASAREALTEMEAMLDQLRAAPLEAVGLVEALKKQCEALEFRTGARVTVDLAGVPGPGQLRPGAAQSLFRIAQEALANIARHARATEVKLSLAVAERDCLLRIEDNGAGFATGAAGARSGMGLSNMRSRAVEQGGSLDIQSVQGSGTQLTATIPLERPEQKNALRIAWAFGIAAIISALLSLVIKTDFFIGMTRGFSSVMFCASISKFITGRRS